MIIKITEEQLEKLVKGKALVSEQPKKTIFPGEICEGNVFVILGTDYVVGETKVKEHMKKNGVDFLAVLKCDGGKMAQFGCTLHNDKMECNRAYD